MFQRVCYLQLGESRIRFTIHGSPVFFDGAATVAIEGVGKNQKIVAIGRLAEQSQGRPGLEIVRPFSHPRIVVGDYTIAEKLVQLIIRQSIRKLTFMQQMVPMARMIVHPERKFEGGLTQVERRVLIELCENSGARKVAIHTGRALTAEEIGTYPFTAPA